MMHRQKQQTQQQQQQRQQHHQQPMTTPAARGDADGATATTLTTRGKASAAASIAVQCPQCCHRFRLLDCLLAAAGAEATSAGAGQESRTASSTSLSPQEIRRNSGDWQQQQQQQQQHQQHHMNAPQQAAIADGAHHQDGLTGNFISLSSSPPAAVAEATDAALPGNTKSVANRSPSSQTTRPPTLAEEDLQTSEVVRNYQIVNTTIEQLEHIIMDKTDRRIRKISAISGCSIDLRSELPAGRFGVAKNFCVLRSRSEANTDSCRCMLAKQMDWILVAKPS